MGTLFTSFFALLQIYLHREREVSVTRDGIMGAVIGNTPPRRTASELVKLINSPEKIDRMGADELLTVCQDGLQALIRPNMGFEEVTHVRTTLLAPLLALHDRSRGEQNGAER